MVLRMFTTPTMQNRTTNRLLSWTKNAGAGFVDFIPPVPAARAFKVNVARISNSSGLFKLSWASGGAFSCKRHSWLGVFDFSW